jgi:membrane protease YdiL (CAAX protease family)
MKVLKTTATHHKTPTHYHVHRSKLKRSHINPAIFMATTRDPVLYQMFGRLEPYYVSMQEIFNRFMTQSLTTSFAQFTGTVMPLCLCPISCFKGVIANITKQVLAGIAVGSIPTAAATLTLLVKTDPEEAAKDKQRIMEDMQQQGTEYIRKFLTGAAATAIAVRATAEEGMCTGIFDTFKDSFTDLFPGKDVFLAANIATAIFFGMLHWQNHSSRRFKVAQVLGTSVLGFTFGMLREKVGFLSAAIAHAVNNLGIAHFFRSQLS